MYRWLSAFVPDIRWPLVMSARPCPGTSVTVTISVMPSLTWSRRSFGPGGQSA